LEQSAPLDWDEIRRHRQADSTGPKGEVREDPPTDPDRKSISFAIAIEIELCPFAR